MELNKQINIESLETILENVEKPIIESPVVAKPKKKVQVVSLPKVGQTIYKISEEKTEEYLFEETFTVPDTEMEIISLRKANKYSYDGIPKSAFYENTIYKEAYINGKGKEVVTGKTFKYTPNKKAQCIDVAVTNKDGKSLKGYSYKVGDKVEKTDK